VSRSIDGSGPFSPESLTDESQRGNNINVSVYVTRALQKLGTADPRNIIQMFTNTPMSVIETAAYDSRFAPVPTGKALVKESYKTVESHSRKYRLSTVNFPVCSAYFHKFSAFKRT